MAILVSPDSRGRIDLSGVAQDRQYVVGLDEDGVITLTPSVRQALHGEHIIFPTLSPEDVFGMTGLEAAAEAVYVNRESRRRGNPVARVSTEGELHDLIWGDAA